MNMPDVAAIQRLVEEAEAEAVAENGEVRVVARPAGRVKEIDLRMNAFQLSGVELGDLIVETIREANSNLQRELSAEISAQTGLAVSADDFGGGLPDIERDQDQEDRK